MQLPTDSMQLPPNYRTRRIYHETPRSRVWAGTRLDDDQPVVIKEYLGHSPEGRQARVENEYRILDRFDSPQIVRAIDIVGQRADCVLITEDLPDAQTLRDTLADGPLPMVMALRITLELQSALAEVHSQSIVHRDIHPGNVLVHGRRGQLTLIDFGSATELHVEQCENPTPVGLEGSLHYLSPEQSGRTGVALDHRSDYYALGATLYEMLTGVPPFAEAKDPVELIHAHVARTAPRAKLRRQELPEALSAVIAKLLAKAPEDRYQSARGLRADLEYCLQLVENRTDADAEPFEAGRHDQVDRLVADDTLHGREEERSLLSRAFESSCQGHREVVWLVGESGMGKSSLVLQVSSRLAHPGARVAVGKFDALQSSRPYSALLQALGTLCVKISASPPRDMRAQVERSSRLAGDYARIITSLLPESTWLFPQMIAEPEVEGRAAKERTETALLRLVQSFASETHPLLLFLDDLQWADNATLEFIPRLINHSALRHLLFVGAQRPPSNDPREADVDRIFAAVDGHIPTVELFPLSQRHTLEMVRIAAPGLRQAETLAQFIFDRTRGNPYLIRQLLTVLHGHRALYIDPWTGDWSWSEAAARQLSSGEDALHLILQRLTSLPEPSFALLSECAAFGRSFSLAEAAWLTQESPQTTHTLLWPALTAGFILGSPRTHDAVIPDRLAEKELRDFVYTFSHDRIQEACYKRLGAEASHIHTHIVRAYAHHDRPSEDAALIATQIAKADFVQLLENCHSFCVEHCTEAGTLAYRSGAYEEADNYFSLAQRFIDEGPPQLATAAKASQLPLMRLLCIQGRGDHQASLKLARKLLATTTSIETRLRIQRVISETIYTSGDIAGASDYFAEVCQEHNIAIDRNPGTLQVGLTLMRIRLRLARIGAQGLRSLPPLDDPVVVAKQDFELSGLPPAYESGRINQFVMIGLRILGQSLDHGISGPGLEAIAQFGMIESAQFGRHDRAFELAQIALQGFKALGTTARRCSAQMIYAIFISHWRVSKRQAFEAARKAVEYAEFEGDQFVVAATTSFQAHHQMHVGDHLDIAVDACRVAKRYTQHNKEDDSPDMLLDMAARLSSARDYDESRFDIRITCRSDTQRAYQAVDRCFIGLLWGYREPLPEAIDTLEQTLASVSATLAEGLARALMPATCYYLYTHADARDKPMWLRKSIRLAKAGRSCLKAWAKHNPSLGTPFHSMLEGVALLAKGRERDGLAELETCIRGAIAASMPQIAGICAHVVAVHHESHGRIELSITAASQASHLYGAWGAQALVLRVADYMEQLAAQHDLDMAPFARFAGHSRVPSDSAYSPGPTLHSGRSDYSLTRSTSDDNASFDLTAVFKAGQDLTQLREPEEIWNTVLEAVVANCGATRSVLLEADHSDASGVRIHATSEINQDGKVCLESAHTPTDQKSGPVPFSVIRRSLHTGERVYLRRAPDDPMHGQDPYIRCRAPKSILCLPLMHQGDLRFLLYIENRELCDAFGPSRLEVAEVLGTQMLLTLESSALMKTLEGRNEELAIALRSARSADEAKSRFLANMSHELRTPLNGIFGSSELLDETELDDDQRDLVETINISSARLHHIISQILDFDDLERGHTQLQVEKIRLDRLIDRIANHHRRAAEAVGLSFSLEPPTIEPTFIDVDPHALSRALAHVLDNAIKFTRKGGIRLSVAMHTDARDESGRTQRLTAQVRDTGIGIVAEDLPKLGNHFSQGDDSSTKRHEGIGLGLASTRRLVTLLGGELEFESSVGEGTTVRIDVPVIRRSGSRPTKLSVTQHPPETAGPSRIKKILVVEDNRLNQTLLARMLRKLGLTADLADDGLQGVSRFEAGPETYGCILMDCQMPNMDGYEATGKIRDRESELQLRRLPIIAVTANALDGDREKCTRAGCDDFLAKPVKLGELREMLAKHGVLTAESSSDAA